MYRIIIVLILFLLSVFAHSEELQVSVYGDGKILLNGAQVSISELEDAFKQPNIEVWYFRENPEAEPHPNAMNVIQMVVENKLPITLSTTPDFSTYVGENGNVYERK